MTMRGKMAVCWFQFEGFHLTIDCNLLLGATKYFSKWKIINYNCFGLQNMAIIALDHNAWKLILIFNFLLRKSVLHVIGTSIESMHKRVRSH